MTSGSQPEILHSHADTAARLLAAARSGDLAEASKVLTLGADPNTVDQASAQTVLMIATGRGHLEVVRMLLEAGADPNAIDRRAGVSALHKGCQRGNVDVVKTLVQAGAFIDHQTTTTGHTPLVEAVWFKAVEVVEYLLAQGARLEPLTYYGFPLPVHVAIAKSVNHGLGLRRLQEIENLIERRRASDKTREDSALLHKAALKGDLAQVRRLLSEKQVVDEPYPMVGGFQDGHTPLLIAAREAHHPEGRPDRLEIVEALIGAGADVNATEPIFGAVPLHKTTYFGDAEATRILTRAPRIDLNRQGPANGYTPLHDALWHASPESAKVLLDAGARADILAYDGRRPLDIAIEELGEDHSIVKDLRVRTT